MHNRNPWTKIIGNKMFIAIINIWKSILQFKISKTLPKNSIHDPKKKTAQTQAYYYINRCECNSATRVLLRRPCIPTWCTQFSHYENHFLCLFLLWQLYTDSILLHTPTHRCHNVNSWFSTLNHHRWCNPIRYNRKVAEGFSQRSSLKTVVYIPRWKYPRRQLLCSAVFDNMLFGIAWCVYAYETSYIYMCGCKHSGKNERISFRNDDVAAAVSWGQGGGYKVDTVTQTLFSSSFKFYCTFILYI